MNQMRGKQSIQFDKAPYLIASSSVVGAKEGEGPLGMMFDRVNEDAQFGEDTWEKAESQMQKEAAQIVLEKAGMMPENIRYLFSGDLLGQLTATSFGAGGWTFPCLDCMERVQQAESLLLWLQWQSAQDMQIQRWL